MKNLDAAVIGRVTDPPVPTACQSTLGPVRAGLAFSVPVAGSQVIVTLPPLCDTLNFGGAAPSGTNMKKFRLYPPASSSSRIVEAEPGMVTLTMLVFASTRGVKVQVWYPPVAGKLKAPKTFVV
jgi:hypothetical protein